MFDVYELFTAHLRYNADFFPFFPPLPSSRIFKTLTSAGPVLLLVISEATVTLTFSIIVAILLQLRCF